jgi:chlorophyllide a reductase subunit Y
MGVAGAGSLAEVINTALAGKERFQTMESFFAGVGSGTKSGIWTPQIIERHGMGEAS